jgi:hypothetical protein
MKHNKEILEQIKLIHEILQSTSTSPLEKSRLEKLKTALLLALEDRNIF